MPWWWAEKEKEKKRNVAGIREAWVQNAALPALTLPPRKLLDLSKILFSYL